MWLIQHFNLESVPTILITGTLHISLKYFSDHGFSRASRQKYNTCYIDKYLVSSVFEVKRGK